MKFTIDLDNKKIIVHGNHTEEDITKIYDMITIDNLSEFTVETLSKESTPDYVQNNTYHPNHYEYHTDDTLNGHLKLIYKNILKTV